MGIVSEIQYRKQASLKNPPYGRCNANGKKAFEQLDWHSLVVPV
jgi:hypothetical protein